MAGWKHPIAETGPSVGLAAVLLSTAIAGGAVLSGRLLPDESWFNRRCGQIRSGLDKDGCRSWIAYIVLALMASIVLANVINWSDSWLNERSLTLFDRVSPFTPLVLIIAVPVMWAAVCCRTCCEPRKGLGKRWLVIAIVSVALRPPVTWMRCRSWAVIL